MEFKKLHKQGDNKMRRYICDPKDISAGVLIVIVVSLWRGICGSSFLLLSFSCSQVVKHKTIIIWVKTLPYFYQVIIFSPKNLFWNKKGVIWWLFREDLGGRGNRNPKFHDLYCFWTDNSVLTNEDSLHYISWNVFTSNQNELQLQTKERTNRGRSTHVYCKKRLKKSQPRNWFGE